jgi:hypothetical protein
MGRWAAIAARPRKGIAIITGRLDEYLTREDLNGGFAIERFDLFLVWTAVRNMKVYPNVGIRRSLLADLYIPFVWKEKKTEEEREASNCWIHNSV